MFSTCRSLQTGLILLALGACSKEPPTTTQSAPFTPAIAPTNEVAANARTLSGRINAAGIEATYEAAFEEQERLRIAEQRADSRRGEYELRGARLLHYSGSGLSSADAIELRFSLQGVLELAKSGSGGIVSQEEISAIRERAQLLRSHALAQKTTRDHY
jgi:outer membrane protein TolC